MTLKLEILDDEHEFCEFVCAVADGMGFETRSTINPEEFVDEYHLGRKEVVLLDLYMPNIDGVELLRFMADTRPPAAIVLMSGGDEQVLKSAQKLAGELGLNVVETIRKPIRKKQLEQVLVKIPEYINSSLEVENSRITPSLVALENALSREEINVVFQPQINCLTGKICAVEALARWTHSKLGQIPPLAFIPMAESYGLIAELDVLVMRQSIRHLSRFHELDPDLRLSINMSAHTFSDLSLPEIITDELGKFHLKPDCLAIEVTETAVMQDLRRSLDILTRLRMKGVYLSIDDFGTGYSSMSQLVRILFSELKIDRSFIKNIDTDKECLAVVRASILLARELGMKTVAEGVSSQTILDMLKELNCDKVQGFFTGKPQSVEKIIELLSGQ